LSLVFIFVVVSAFIYFHTAGAVFAHEQYVLTQQQINEGFAVSDISVLFVLDNPQNLKVALFV